MKTIDDAKKECRHHYANDSLNILGVSDGAFQKGVDFAQRWIKVEDETPLAYEQGNWDGKRSDFVLAKNKWGTIYIVRAYKGGIDGHEYCDFVEKDNIVVSNIVEWRPIEYV